MVKEENSFWGSVVAKYDIRDLDSLVSGGEVPRGSQVWNDTHKVTKYRDEFLSSKMGW